MRYTWEPLSPESQTVCLWALHIHIADGSICPWTCGLPWPERRVRAGEGAPGTWTHTAHSPLDGHASPPTPTSFIFSALTSSSSVLISSDLLLADNNRNKEQHRFLACVRFFPPLICGWLSLYGEPRQKADYKVIRRFLTEAAGTLNCQIVQESTVLSFFFEF